MRIYREQLKSLLSLIDDTDSTFIDYEYLGRNRWTFADTAEVKLSNDPREIILRSGKVYFKAHIEHREIEYDWAKK